MKTSLSMRRQYKNCDAILSTNKQRKSTLKNKDISKIVTVIN